MMRWDGFGSSHQGLVRPTNQDAFFVDNRLQIWVVADGMGGHPGGDVASRLVVDTITGEVDRAADLLLQASSQHIETVLSDMVEAAHRAILAHARSQPSLTGMGTTVTLLHISPAPEPTATVIHEGDSRAYLVREGRLRQLTRDHSLVEEHVRQGLLSPTEALHHPQRHVLSRALGLGPRSNSDIIIETLRPHDRLMLCTDGLTKLIDDVQIEHRLAAEPHDPQSLCLDLIQMALSAGGIDNVTVVVAVGQK